MLARRKVILSDDGDRDEPFGARMVHEMWKSRLEAASARYSTIVNRLWAGCGGGLIASVTAIRHPSDPFFWLTTGSFGLGVLLLGIGALMTLYHDGRVIRHLEEIGELLEMRSVYVERPSAQAGLSVSHPQTWTALIAAGLFVLGVLFASVVVARGHS
jgi:hypothetical protein